MTKNIHRRDAEAQSDDCSVLQIGMQYFWFDSHEKAAKAFELLSKATHVEQQYKPRPKGPYHDFAPRELIGEISVKMVRRETLVEKKGGATRA